MIKITERAKKELKKILSASVDNWYAGLRLVSRGHGEFGLGVDVEMPGDHVVEYAGSKILLVEPALFTGRSEINIDIEDTGGGDGNRLIISLSGAD
jgi:Fe-S cluster assembly iron-binding protein IscA